MELGNLLKDTGEVRLEEIEVSHGVHKIQHTMWSELRTVEHFAQDRLHCTVHLNTYVTIDGHTSVQVNLRRNKTGLIVCGQLLVLPGRNVPLALKKYMHRAANPSWKKQHGVNGATPNTLEKGASGLPTGTFMT